MLNDASDDIALAADRANDRSLAAGPATRAAVTLILLPVLRLAADRWSALSRDVGSLRKAAAE